MNYYISAITNNYLNFDGRARREEYWIFALVNFVVGVIIAFIVFLTEFYLLSSLYSLFIFLPSLATTIRRLHDIGKSGVWFLICFIPLIGPLWLLILTLTEGTRGSNAYGNDPKAY